MMMDDFSPSVVIADVLLKGNTVFPFLHELASYEDTWNVPVILITTEAEMISGTNLTQYGVVRVLDKSTMGVDDIITATRRVLNEG